MTEVEKALSQQFIEKHKNLFEFFYSDKFPVYCNDVNVWLKTLSNEQFEVLGYFSVYLLDFIQHVTDSHIMKEFDRRKDTGDYKQIMPDNIMDVPVQEWKNGQE